MIKHAMAICSFVAMVIGYYYGKSSGLIISLDVNGAKIYSNSLQSSGSNDGFIMSIGFLSFGLTLISSLLAYLKMLSERKLKFIYLANFAILAFIVFLVNLDTSVFDSIKMGDTSLLVGFIITILPLTFCFTKNDRTAT